jgi:hypothetical protein
MGFFKSQNRSRRVGAGTKVTVYTVDNWKGDGTGGTPGEVMEVDSVDAQIMWETASGEVSVDEFNLRTRRSNGGALQAWFQLRDEPFAPAPQIPAVGPWSDEK